MGQDIVGGDANGLAVGDLRLGVIPLVTFFIDRCLGKNLATHLRAQGMTVEIHDDHFAKDAQDVDWLPIVGQRGWVVLTQDERIAKRALEPIAVTRAQVSLFVLVAQSLSGAEISAAFTTARDAMERYLASYPAPFIAKVYRDGRVELWKDRESLQAEIFPG